MFKLADRVKETSVTTGTGSVALAGAATGYQSFLAGIGEGNRTYYAIAHQTITEWEVGVGTYSTGALSRDTVLASTNAGARVNFSAGLKDVFVTMPAEATTASYLNMDGGVANSVYSPGQIIDLGGA